MFGPFPVSVSIRSLNRPPRNCIFHQLIDCTLCSSHTGALFARNECLLGFSRLHQGTRILMQSRSITPCTGLPFMLHQSVSHLPSPWQESQWTNYWPQGSHSNIELCSSSKRIASCLLISMHSNRPCGIHRTFSVMHQIHLSGTGSSAPAGWCLQVGSQTLKCWMPLHATAQSISGDLLSNSGLELTGEPGCWMNEE